MVCTPAYLGRRGVVLLTFLFCVFGLLAPVAAQDATIFGQVTDASGAVLPGVTVTVSSPALIQKQVVEVTNATGEYRITPLPLGLYTVEYSLGGFQTLRREDIRLTVGFVARLDVALKLGALSESITVSGASPVVDVQTTSSGTQVTREILASTPTQRNGLNSLLTLAAGARPALDNGRIQGADPVIKAFGRANNGWIMVNGIATTSATANSGFQNTFSYETVQEAAVTTVGNSAEAPNSGIQINVITKSGGNDFHGEVPLAQTFEWMQANNIDDELRAQGIPNPSKFTRRWDRGADVGGRIKRDMVWFYTAARMRTEAADIPGAPDMPDGSHSQFQTDQKFFVGKLTNQLTSSQQLNGFGQWRKQLRRDGPASRFNAPEQTRRTTYTTNMGQGEYQLVKSNKVLGIRGGAYLIQFPWRPTMTDIPAWSDVVTGFSGGAHEDTGTRTDMRRLEGKATLGWYKSDWFHGNHDFKMGASYDVSGRDDKTQDVGLCTPTEPIESLCNPAFGPGNYALSFRSGVSDQVAIKNAPVSPATRLDYAAIYIQDSWSINRRLTLNVGVRYANDRAWLPEQCRADATAPFTSLFPAQCFPVQHLKTYNPVVPRIHVAYDLTGDGKTVVKGGWGRFQKFHTAEELALANPNASVTSTYLWRDLNANRRWDVGETDLSTSGRDFVSQSQAGLTSSLVGLVPNPDLKAPGNDEYSLSLERQLISNLAVRVTGVYTHELNTLRLLNTLRPYEVFNIPINNPDPGPDNRLGTADDTGKIITYWDYPAALRGAAFQRPMYINDANSDATYKSIEISATKRLSNRWQLQAAYTGTRKDIPVPAGSNFDPNTEINAADNIWEWLTQVSGTYIFPADIQVSGNVLSQNGDAWGRTVSVRGGTQIPSLVVRVEPIGFRNTGTMTLVGLRAEKVIRFKGQHKVNLGANVINLLNANFINNAGTSNAPASGAASVQQRSGDTFGLPTAIAFPLTAEVVVKYSF